MSKWSVVFAHTIVIRRRTWKWFGWVIEPFWRGVGLQHTRGLCGSPVNRWSIKRTPNDTKFDRRSTGGVPRPLGKSRSIPRMFNTRTRKRQKGAPEDVGVSDCKTDNGEKARMPETNTYANAMHMMTLYEMHDMKKMQNEDKTQP